MRIAVIGAGIVGVTTAYELAADGHEVVVLERHSSVAAEASFANAGVMAPGLVGPWAASGMRMSLLRGLLGGGGPLRARLSLDPAQWRWLQRWWGACDAAVDRHHRAELLRLGQYSRERLEQLSTRHGFEFERAQGVLLLLRGDREVAQAQPGLAVLRELGTGVQQLDAAGCHAIEPGLNRDQPIAAGIHLPQEGIGNCRQFAHLLREATERSGAEFRFCTVVRSIQVGDGARGIVLHLEQMALTTGFVASRAAAVPAGAARADVMAHRTRAAARYLAPVSSERFDAIVIAAGADSVGLLEASGLRVPLMPVYGYSMTAPLRSPDRGPRAALVDQRHQVVIGRLGQRVRVAGGAELGGSAQHQRDAAIKRLYAVLNDWFPGGAHTARPQLWKGARPMLPDGPPLVGPSPRAGIWLNLGHGGSGWALACGSARLLADQIGGRTPALDPAPLAPSRYARG